MPSESPVTTPTRVAIGLCNGPSVASANAVEDNGRGGGGRLAWAGLGDTGGAGARPSNPKSLAGGCVLVGSVGARATAAWESLPLSPLRAEAMGVDGIEQGQEDGATAKEDAMAE